jgi:tetratricopeptide (TPR) repeat protein
MVVAQLAPAAAVKPKSTGVTAVVPVMVPVVTRAAKEATSAQLAAGRPALPVSQPTPVLTKQTGPMTQSAHQGAMDILAQAQALWSQSDQVGALALVQGAITHLEQIPAADNTALANMAREHTRMALAMENPQAALSTLVRLESQLSTVADIWALRGNLNQRLGQHPRAVQAYLASLALRPNEPRWMLGAAVSLAIQGQIGPASEWTEKARLAGGLRTDVANYLRQLGVEIRVE